MATTVRRTKFDPVSTFKEHLVFKTEAKTITARAEALKKRLKDWLPNAADAYQNENGSIFYDLPEAVEVGGKTYSGMELRRSVTTTFNEEKAEEILRRKQKKDETILTDAQSSYVDQEKIARLQQEGRLTEKEVDSMFEDNEKFAFWPVEGEVY